jgi:hypothetical protein
MTKKRMTQKHGSRERGCLRFGNTGKGTRSGVCEQGRLVLRRVEKPLFFLCSVVEFSPPLFPQDNITESS